MSYMGMVAPVTAAASGLFDTRVFQHVLLAGPIVKLVLLMLIVFSVVSWAIIFLKSRLFRITSYNVCYTKLLRTPRYRRLPQSSESSRRSYNFV